MQADLCRKNLNGAERLKKGKCFPSRLLCHLHPKNEWRLSGAIAKPVAVLAGVHVRNMDYNVHMHVDNVKFEYGFPSK